MLDGNAGLKPTLKRWCIGVAGIAHTIYTAPGPLEMVHGIWRYAMTMSIPNMP